MTNPSCLRGLDAWANQERSTKGAALSNLGWHRSGQVGLGRGTSGLRYFQWIDCLVVGSPEGAIFESPGHAPGIEWGGFLRPTDATPACCFTPSGLSVTGMPTDYRLAEFCAAAFQSAEP